MTDVTGLIAEFEALPGDESGGDAKWRIIADLDESLGDPRVLELFLKVVADREEYDLARIECLKVLDLYPPDDRVRVGRVIAGALDVEDDYLVRQYAAMSLGPYAGDPVVFEALSVAVLEDEDVDVRHNALESLVTADPDERITALLHRLTEDPELGSAAKRTLRERG
ncbi:HEAT repeat domain-containing protein [Actinocrispum sp. NPDC049592]|uniref:HEAT repeat domain-containing protein n=1 Tax=Actinocrispum sp. NPDC049592 TaxID=3154835 RepID=UPI0034242E14